MIPTWATTIIRHRRHPRLAWAERYVDGARAVDIQGGMEFPLRTESWEATPWVRLDPGRSVQAIHESRCCDEST